MNAQIIRTIRINPPRFWAATKNMTSPEIESIIEEIMESVAKGDISALNKYDFVAIDQRDN